MRLERAPGVRLRFGGREYSLDECPEWLKTYHYSATSGWSRLWDQAARGSPLPIPAPLAELEGGSAGKFDGLGPPPPRPHAHGHAANFSQTVQENTVSHESAAGWTEEEIEAWRWSEARAKRYDDPNGREAVRFLREDVPLWIRHHPDQVDVEDCREVVRQLRRRAEGRGRHFTNNSARTYLDYLNSYLWRAWGNRVVRDSGVRGEYPKKTSRTPAATAPDWERIASLAVGPETIVVALEWPNRRVEIRQARLVDIHLARETMDFRCKNGHDEVTDWDSPLTMTQVRALRTYLPWRRALATDSRCLGDDGHLLTRRHRVMASDLRDHRSRELGFVLVGVSNRKIDRLLARAVERAFPDPLTRPWIPGHSLRRGGLTTLHDRSAEEFGVPDWESVQAAAHHQSMGTTEPYVKSLLLKRRLPSRMRLLDPRATGAT